MTTVGSPDAWASWAPLKASGERMPPWKWATSTSSSASTRATSANTEGVSGVLSGTNGRRRWAVGTDTRTTRTPSISAGPGVVVTTTTRWPAARRCTARSWACTSMPPVSGR